VWSRQVQNKSFFARIFTKSLGVKASLSKCDVSDAFKNIPLNPETWHLFGFKWEDTYYFYTRLCFGCSMKGPIRYPFSSSLLTNNDTSSAYLVADKKKLHSKV
jgi:hypothetical protein